MAGNNRSYRGQNLSNEDRSRGGSMSGGNFKNDPQRASEAGKKGGEARSNQRNSDNNQ